MSEPTSDAVILGAGGMLGRALVESAARRGIGVRALARADFDILHGDLSRLSGARVIINAAAYTNVDGAESDRDAAFALNAEAPARLAAHCAETGARYVDYGTDYVFAGDATAPYPEDAPHDPRSVYGASKAEGERRVLAASPDHLVIRTSWLFAPWGKNFARTMVGLARDRDVLRVVNDQRGRPTFCPDLADATWSLLEAGAGGVFHGCNSGEATWYEFARELVRASGSACRVEPCTTDEFPRPAPRPAYSVLGLTRLEATIGALPPWTDRVDAVVAAS